MARSHLSQEQVREVLQRAGEIDQMRLRGIEDLSDVDTVIAAAQEVGVSREAIVQAMQEQLDLLGEPPTAGDRVFAKSANGKFYPAEVTRVNEGTMVVRFLSGGETTLSSKDIRPFNVTPGSKLVCNWPDWGWWTCTVLAYDEAAGKVRISDNWGSEETVALTEVYLDSKQFEQRGASLWSRISWQAGLLFAAGGGILGSLATWLLTR